MPGVARPVRTLPNSSLANSIARSIFSSASKRVSSITWCSASFVGYVNERLRTTTRGGSAQRRGGLGRDGGDQSADLLTFDGPDHGVIPLGGEDQHRQPILLT